MAERVTAESLFETYFLPLYPEDARRDLARARAEDANPAQNPGILAHLGEASEVFVAQAARLFGEDLALDHSDASIHRLSRALTPERRDAWAKDGEAGTPGSTLFNAVVHGAAYVGACIVRGHEGVWRVRRPLWESLVFLRSRAGEAELAVFSWWLRSLADDARDTGATLADRYRALVEVPRARPEELPVFLGAERPLPRLKKPRYDLFFKYLKAHLPELKDLGRDFPSPERFDELGFAWLDFLVLGGGRMLLVAGLGRHGVHLYWLDASGFQKAAFYPAEKFPDPVVRKDGEKIQLLFQHEGKTQQHEILWWGP